ncbi:unnamed protein product [Discosporangium mesarthrocarpum]
MRHHQPAGAALCVAKKWVFGTAFDHAAVVVQDRFGTPLVAEATYSGVKFRRFDERVLRSRCAEIMLLPLGFSCGEDRRAKVERHVKGMTYRKLAMDMVLLESLGLFKLLSKLWKPGDNPTLKAGTGEGARVGGGESDGGVLANWVAASPAVQLVMSCLDEVGAVDGEEVGRWKDPLLITTRDLEERLVPLSEGAEFGRGVPIRINQ